MEQNIKDLIYDACHNLHNFYIVESDYDSSKNEVYIKGYKLDGNKYIESTFLIEGEDAIKDKLCNLF